ncbi:hypothetical protein CO663_18380 [Rhizobium anhuiense]|uniref:hypothetical protein n=1 Tax=Rhizobium anhuiense TaxID=1184720 RepID=UPI000BEA359C|nr:hypothetical protein [Rhizobium anhuiense]PDS57285.1 hypothetical protein CO663_18380 [Rhizobium anhuiense]
MTTCAGIAVEDEKGHMTTLGPILANHGKLYSVVASHAVQRGATLKAVGTDAAVGKVQDGVLQSSKIPERDISYGLRTVELHADTLVDDSVVLSKLVDPLDFLGERVLKRGASGDTEGVVTAVDAPFHMKDDKTKSILKYSGAFEITSTGTEPFAKRGDAGSVICAPNGDVIGILIGKAGERFYAAPATGLYTKFDLSLASSVQRFAHNRPIKQKQAASAALRPVFRGVVKSTTKRPSLSPYGFQFDASERLHAPEPRGARLGWDKILHGSPDAARIGTGVISSGKSLFLSSPGHSNEHFLPKFSQVLESPDLGVEGLFGRLKDVVLVLGKHARNDVFTSKYNFVVGTEHLLASPKASYQNVMQGLVGALNNVGADAQRLLKQYGAHISPSAYHQLQTGRHVSFASAALLLVGLREALKGEHSSSWSKAYLDPAIYYIEAGGRDLEQVLHNKRIARNFEDTFRQLAPMRYRQVSVSRLVGDVAQGQPVRHATASAMTKAADIVGMGELVWKQALNGDTSPAQAENSVSTASLAQKRRDLGTP